LFFQHNFYYFSNSLEYKHNTYFSLPSPKANPPLAEVELAAQREFSLF